MDSFDFTAKHDDLKGELVSKGLFLFEVLFHGSEFPFIGLFVRKETIKMVLILLNLYLHLFSPSYLRFKS